MSDETLTRPALKKAPTGIPGLDEITNGGFPAGRPTLISGGFGSGKTLLGISFLINGATRYDERGRRSMPCSEAWASFEAARSWCLETPARARQRSRRTSLLKVRNTTSFFTSLTSPGSAMPSSDEVREFRFTNQGIDILPMPAAAPEGQ